MGKGAIENLKRKTELWDIHEEYFSSDESSSYVCCLIIFYDLHQTDTLRIFEQRWLVGGDDEQHRTLHKNPIMHI